ncbi:MAG: M23 family metallopeptidase [Alphaproteobacteria bacterium]|nr:M23 family metallopeptidase [Alphaproteobacteria bacterium]MBV8407058.1 M23 family metallopeptidase [Alphaproteobacteria bacterium]
MLAGAFLLVCGPASHGTAFDADLTGSLGAGEQSLAGQTEVAAAAPPMALQDRPARPFVSRELALSGFVGESFEASLARSGAPADLSLKLGEALASALGAGSQLHRGDKFYVRYEQTFAGDGREVGPANVVSAEIMTADKGRIAFYRFRPTHGTEELWLASGESLAAPAMRLPLQTINVSSGFGVRADPFEQPRNGLGAPSRVGSVGATLNTATARGVALGLAPGPGKVAGRGGASFLMHNGVDLVAPTGTPIHAASDGKVVGAAPNAGYGNWIRIEHAHNVATVYGHLSEFAPGISAGVEVHQGQVIGFVGNTGRSTGPHLHFEVIKDGKAIDPLTFPETKRARLEGADLESFRKLVRQLEAARHDETAFLPISVGGAY